MPRKEGHVEPQGLTRHFNEALILTSLARGAKHGYQLALDVEERSGGRFGFKHGTLYPILHKLEKEGKIKGAWLKDDSKRKRKQYSLTAQGRTKRTVTGRVMPEPGVSVTAGGMGVGVEGR